MKYSVIILLVFLMSCNERKKHIYTKRIENVDTIQHYKKPIPIEEISTDKKKNITKDTLTFVIKNNQVVGFKLPDNLLEDYEIKINKNEIKITNVLYESILGHVLKFESNDTINKIRYKMKINFSVSQYAIEESFNLDYGFSLESNDIETNQPYIDLPVFTYLEKDTLFGKMFGFDNNKALYNKIEKEHFKKIKPISLKKRQEIYQKVLNNKEEYTCCPGYIKDAKEFFNKKRIKTNKFETFNDLVVEVYPNIIKMDVILTYKNGKKVKIKIKDKFLDLGG